MLIKEYRILFPMSVEEYKIGQLYMIQKMSRLESEIDGGVEIITNEPYDDGPGGSGQYTFKIYHIGNKIPSWIRNVLPSAALQANEEAWNAYPFTRTRHSSPLMDRFSIEIETLYFNDTGTQNNVFKLSGSELKNRVVDVIDFVKDSHDCPDDENPRIYKSAKTNRGPLSDDWVKEYVQSGKPIMCAYKLCKVEFRYWGMQTRVERWIHDLALKSMLLKSHLKAWIWQDEWPSLIRWSSELLVGEGESPPSTPKLPNSSLLVLVFHGDVYPESPADSKTTDSSTLRSTLDSLILNHYPQLKNKVHVRRVTCGSELNKAVANLSALSPTFGAFHPSLSLLLAAGNQLNDAVEGTISRANKAVEDFYNSPEGKNFCGEIFIVGDCIGGILMYEMLYQRSNYSNHLPISRHSSSISAQSRPI
uniref:Phosphatidylinositol transfer protein n=1 Tax=Panagrolaimus sp. PS1159 TaxID=55785 RepID=A0AC35EUE7_9BILA